MSTRSMNAPLSVGATPRTPWLQRAGDVFTRLAPAIMIGVVAPRALRVPGVHEPLGLVLATLFVAALAWFARDLWQGRASPVRQLRAACGLLFALPFALMLLLWVGLATPWDATKAENEMRFLVLSVGAVAMTVGFLTLGQALRDAGERVWSTLGGAVALPAGVAYLVWTCFTAGFFVVAIHGGRPTDAFPALSDVLDTLEFFACALTYLATLLHVVALARQGWLGRKATVAFLLFAALLLLLLVLRGVAYPDPTASTTPWYARPGFIAGIPAVPWILPYLMGLAQLRDRTRD